jgi:hypothetical protein
VPALASYYTDVFLHDVERLRIRSPSADSELAVLVAAAEALLAIGLLDRRGEPGPAGALECRQRTRRFPAAARCTRPSDRPEPKARTDDFD